MSEELAETPTSTRDDALAQKIAKALNEPNVVLIGKLIGVIGPARAQAFLVWYRRTKRTPESGDREILAMRKERGRVNRSLFEKIESRSFRAVY